MNLRNVNGTSEIKHVYTLNEKCRVYYVYERLDYWLD